MFDTQLESGKNQFVLKGKAMQQTAPKVFRSTIVNDMAFSQGGFNLSVT